MDDDVRGFDATLAFLAEFQDSNYEPDGCSLPEPTSCYDFGRSYHGAVAATPDSTASSGQQKNPSTVSAGTKTKTPRRPRSQKTSNADSKATSQVKTSRKKSVAETVVTTETNTRSEITETVTTLKPLSKKDEIEFLREQVVDLEKTLHELRNSSQGERTYGQRLEASASQEARKKPKRILSMWEELAASQSKQRQSAQVENMKLKTKLGEQLKLAESLQRMMKRSKNDEKLLDKSSKTPR